MRWLVCFLVVSGGCVATLPAGDPSITADIAAETARMVILMRQDMPPTPTPSSNVCENCDGAGKVRSGDGISVFTCPVCKGTGKKQPSVLKHPPVVLPCPDGKCRP